MEREVVFLYFYKIIKTYAGHSICLFSYSFVRKIFYFVKEMKDSSFIIDDIKKRKDMFIKWVKY